MVTHALHSLNSSGTAAILIFVCMFLGWKESWITGKNPTQPCREYITSTNWLVFTTANGTLIWKHFLSFTGTNCIWVFWTYLPWPCSLHFCWWGGNGDSWGREVAECIGLLQGWRWNPKGVATGQCSPWLTLIQTPKIYIRHIVKCKFRLKQI